MTWPRGSCGLKKLFKMSDSYCGWAVTASWVRESIAQGRSKQGEQETGLPELALPLREMPGPPSPWGTFPSSPVWFRNINPIAVNRDFFFLEAHAPASRRHS